MVDSNLIQPSHLSRKAIVYVRQSTPGQVTSHKEGLLIQTDLTHKAISLGWPAEAVEIMDWDLGISGADTSQREGFKDVVARVALGEIGIILAFDVARISRNCSDWYPLLDLCSYFDCLIAHQQGVYSPATPNGRFFLGMKGQMSELELHHIFSRMQAGIISKAKRGELALPLPVGYARDSSGKVTKDPNLEVQHRINLIFEMFTKLQSGGKVFLYFKKINLMIPRYTPEKETVWKQPKNR